MITPRREINETIATVWASNRPGSLTTSASQRPTLPAPAKRRPQHAQISVTILQNDNDIGDGHFTQIHLVVLVQVKIGAPVNAHRQRKAGIPIGLRLLRRPRKGRRLPDSGCRQATTIAVERLIIAFIATGGNKGCWRHKGHKVTPRQHPGQGIPAIQL